MTADDCELLFFDTFSHESCEELNLDLVQFPRPVYIFEIRVIPLGARVQADFPGGHRLGATHPSSFQLEFFVNDLSKRGACTFEQLGSLEYKQNVEIQFLVGNKIPTDGLVLRGLYSAVTLAVYGILTKSSTKERSSPPPPPPPQTVPRSQPQDHRSVADTSVTDWDHHPRSVEVPDAVSAVHPHVQQLVEAPRFGEVPPIIQIKPEPHVQYSAEMPQPVYPDPTPPSMVYPECIPASVPSVPPPPPPPPPVSYTPYDAPYSKPWPPPEGHYRTQTEGYDSQAYTRPPDTGPYLPPASVPQPVWEPKECHPPEMTRQEIDSFEQTFHEHKGHSRSKDRRDKPWERDNVSSDVIKDEDLSRDRDCKRKERRSWERGSSESDRYRDRDHDRMKDGLSRDHDRERDRSRDKLRSHDSYSDRSSRPPVKRPATPPTPPSSGHSRTPQTPPDIDKMVSGPRTPKEEEPTETFEDRGSGGGSRASNLCNVISPERRPLGELMYNLSEGEIQEGENTDDDGYEEIVSEEEIMSDGEERVLDIVDIEYDIGDETWNYMSSFSPYHCELTSCQNFIDPTLTPFEIAVAKKDKDKVSCSSDTAAPKKNKILEMIGQFEGKEHTEKWVEALESLNSQIISDCILSIESKEEKDGAVDTLIEWVVEGLNFDLALNQPQTAYKVRHLKAGVHLSSLLFCTSSEIVGKLLAQEVPRLLLQLMDQPYMMLPLKLLILRSLDAALNTKQVFQFFLRKALDFAGPKDFDAINGTDNGTTSKTAYQKLLETLVSKQLTQAVVSISALLEKIHLYEVLEELHESIEKAQSEQKSLPEEPASSGEVQQLSSGETQIDSTEIASPSSSSSWEENAHVIIACLSKICSCYKEAWRKIAQPKRHVPTKTQFQFPKSPFNPYPGLLRMFKETHLLESILILLSSSPLLNHPGVVSSARDLILELLQTNDGMLLLLTFPDTVNGIQKALLQNIDESREESSDENVAHNLGMNIVYRLQALLYIDCLFQHHSKGPEKELDDPDAVSALHHMYTMIFSPVGRIAVVDVLSAGRNLNALVLFLQMTGEEEADIKISKSVCAGYATELLMLTVSFSENVSLLENFSEPLFNLSQQESTPKLHDLGIWVSPARKIPSYTHESVPILSGIVKDHLENASSVPPELVTALRILKHICLPPGNDNKELRYMYAAIQLFANDGLAYFVTSLQNICDTYLKPFHQSVALVGQQGILLVALVKLLTSLMRTILGYLISCRQTDFKDLSAVPVLLQTYSLMFVIPPSSFSFPTAHLVQEEIIETLLTYTQPSLGPEESEEALSKSLWTKMVQEVLKYVQQSPRTFITGLSVLSELWPLPLPLQTREPLKAEEISRTINHRKLWSAHLHSSSGMLQDVIRSLAASSSHPLQQLLRRICIQLADLATPSALIVIRAVLDALLETVGTENKEAADNATPVVPPAPPANTTSPRHLSAPCSTVTTRILNLMSYLVSHSAFKIPMMHILKANTKTDEKYADVLSILLTLLNSPSDKPTHVQSQECIVSILQSLCDPDIGFVTVESGASVNDVLASCLPAREHMLQMCASLVQHIGNENFQYASILPSLRSLVMLTEHDYGFYHVKLALEQHPGVLVSLFCRLSSSFSKDSSDCLSTLSTTLEFLRLMVNGYEEGAQTGRSMLLQPSELANLLSHQDEGGKVKVEKGKESTFQPLLELEKFLSETTSDEEAIESLLESISSLLLLLNEGSAKEEKSETKDVVEPVLPQAESLTNQFASRPVFLLGEIEEERLSPAYWLSIPVSDEADQEQEQVTVDLQSLAEKCISGDCDLKSTLETFCSSAETEADLKKDKSLSFGTKRKYQNLVNPSAEGGIKRPFIAPMRGRGFSRVTTHSTRANDPFRSRPPNTSRPPSMHVDDFVALESHHTGSNPQAQQKRQDGPRGRGRGGFERGQIFPSIRGGNSGGRFFSPPGQYSRREPSNRGARGTPRISNSAWGNRANTSVLKSPANAGMRTNFGNRPSLTDRCYSSSFPPPDLRLAPQRGRDPYPEVELSPGAVSMRFSRAVRATSGLGPPVQGHWQETRNKAQNQRFISSGSAGRGGNRRDMNTRHARSFTR